MARVVRRPLAGADIADIWDFIAEDSITQADAWVDRLDGKLRLLATQPLMGRTRSELSSGLRSQPFERYVIFYEPLTDGIDVVRIIHSARDIQALFAPDPGLPEHWPGKGTRSPTTIACKGNFGIFPRSITLNDRSWPARASPR